MGRSHHDLVPVSRHGQGLQLIGDLGIHDDGIGVDHGAHGVKVHGGSLLMYRYGKHGVSGTKLEGSARNAFGTC